MGPRHEQGTGAVEYTLGGPPLAGQGVVGTPGLGGPVCEFFPRSLSPSYGVRSCQTDMRRPQDEAALRVEPLGLERGRGDRGSRAVVCWFRCAVRK